MVEFFNVATYDYNSGAATPSIPETYVQVAEIITPVREAGIYEFGLSSSYTYDQIINSAYFRFSLDGGVSWNEFAREPKDSTDRQALFYQFPKQEAADGVLQMRLEARKDTAAGIMEILFADVWIKRVG